MDEMVGKRGQALGAHWDGRGVNFAAYSEHAEKMEVCLFGHDGQREIRRAELAKQKDGIWSVYLDGVDPGVHYGYRVYGAWEPLAGHRFNPNKLLLDPYARSVKGDFTWRDSIYPFCQRDALLIDEQDNAALVPKSVVVDDGFEWGADTPPRVPMAETIVYELHIKGFTQLNPAVPEPLRGTYLGLTAPAVIEYLQSLGVTTLELLPCATTITNQRLHNAGLVNYWGYDPIAPFAPDQRYAQNDATREFKQMVKELHQAGLEVVLDVVFNHSGEGDLNDLNIVYRGFDNKNYYHHDADDSSAYLDFTGCGNSLNVGHPAVCNMVLDCLRYWVREMHVDGFRFDLASTVCRTQHGFDPECSFLQSVKSDPILSQVKLIAEPWDLGAGGYQLGGFPEPWSEWNDKYRNAVRAFWRGDENVLPEFVNRFSGSADVYKPQQRTAAASINFVTAHDGFTLRDLFSYNKKRNEANAENNKDGEDNNLSHNHGIEGDTDDMEINALRQRQQCNTLATLLLSHGIPMMLAGDERNHSQRGNNNTYCQDNETSWIGWSDNEQSKSVLEFTQLLIQLRKRFDVFTHLDFLDGELCSESGDRDVVWLRPDGKEMLSEDWEQSFARCISILLSEKQRAGRHFLLILNAGDAVVDCVLPESNIKGLWVTEFDTALWPDTYDIGSAETYPVQAKSFVLFREIERKQ